MNYPSVWQILLNGNDAYHFSLMKIPAIALALGVLIFLMVLWLKKGIKTQGDNILFMAFILTFACVLFLPAMHERYGYIYEILAICIAIKKPKTIPLCIALSGITLRTYGSYLFGVGITNFNWYAIANVALFVTYAIILTKEMSLSVQNELN